uniref:RING-type domain-containing protein n=1 Tax=Chlamydomonas leiostraca TaxID=1034604 RepID=A0A7S0RGQ1_9CHLO|mmetsp:Transcript_22557/g.57304  ORF Transcript_22557/g.57304 Transcript_22557/m.57304 type:complete len:542 (+) Transcript_22557:172-1797(+)
MGQSHSSPAERIYVAVAKNNVVELQRLCATHLTGNPEADRQMLSHKDSEGRTPLIIAASKNYHECARVLLRYGHPDMVHMVNTTCEGRGGSALHEAARNRYEAMADLLLAHGANPFVANSVGRTALDEAVLAAAPAIVRAFQHKALWAGQVAVKTNKLAGLSAPYKTRWCVVLPHFPCPKAGNQEPVRKQLWVFKDQSAVQPKCCVWLDGSSTYHVNTQEAVLRLHTSHAKPTGDVFTRFDRGYCLFLRPAALTESAATSFARFMSLCNLTGPVMPSVLAPASNSTGGTGIGVVLPPPSPAVGPPVGAASSGPYPAVPAGTVSFSPSVGPLTQGLQHQSSAQRRSAQSEPGPVFGTSQGRVVSEEWADSMSALPGESDEEFAARLASAFSATGGQAQDAVLPRTSSRPSRSHQPHATATPAASSSSPFASAAGDNSPSSPTLSMPPCAASVMPSPFPTPSKSMEPTAPPLATSPSLTAAAAASAREDEQLCVICLSAKKEAGFLHGTTVHMCVCRDCCKMIRPGGACPLCRQPVERVIEVY